ncbi:MAG: hypothetical protein ABI178_11635 [Rhodanobacter sp.]
MTILRWRDGDGHREVCALPRLFSICNSLYAARCYIELRIEHVLGFSYSAVPDDKVGGGAVTAFPP